MPVKASTKLAVSTARHLDSLIEKVEELQAIIEDLQLRVTQLESDS